MSEYSEKFLEFWNVYPRDRRQAKPQAFKSWKKHDCEKMADRIIAHVAVRAKRDKQWLDGFCPMPSTFLNNARWEDEWVERKLTLPPEARPFEAPTPPPQGDPWKATLNRILVNLLMKSHGVSESCMVKLLSERDWYARQCNEMWGQDIPQPEGEEVLAGIRNNLRQLIREN